MSSKNVEKKKYVSNKGEIIVGKRTQYKSPYKKDKNLSTLNRNDLNITLPSKFLESNTYNFLNDITEEREKKLPTNSKRSYLTKINNSINNYGFNDNTYMFPMLNKDFSVLTESNLFDNSSTNSNTTTSKNNKNRVMKNVSSQNNKTNIKNMALNNNINASILSNNNTSALLNDNLSFQSEPYDSKYSIKINKIKDDYIDFLQKEFEDNTKKSVKLDSNNKELLKKCDDLIHDNRVLNNTLNDRTTKLNKIIQENIMIKSQLDKMILTNQKNEQKLEFYEEQFNLFKSSNENYQKIIAELKEQNSKLNLSLVEMEKTNEDNLKNAEQNYKNQIKDEIENTKKEMEEIYEKKSKEQSDKNDKKAEEFMDKIKELEDKNEQLINDLTNKENMFDMVCKENEKITNENNLIRTQIDQYSHQINELNTIIKHKDTIINNLKSENLNQEKFLNKSSSCSMMKFEGNDYINENISKLITDNEENKMKIELLNDKIKSIDEIERKYNEIMNGSRTIPLSEKLAHHINSTTASPKNISTHFNYGAGLNDIKNTTTTNNTKPGSKFNNNKSNNFINTNNFRSFISPKRLELIGEINVNSPDIVRSKYEKTEFNILDKDKSNKRNGNNVIIYSSNANKDNKRKKIKETTYDNKDKSRYNIDRDIKLGKNNKIIQKENKNTISKTKIIETKTTPIKGRYFQKFEDNRNKLYEDKKPFHGKELQLEKDEVKESIREMNRKKNYTHKPKIFNYSLDTMNYGQGQKNADQILNIGHTNTYIDKIEEERNNETFYLYGIDRNDVLHIFDITNKKWAELKKISEIEDKSDTFRKDYQYEGTLLYNTLTGVYILTGSKTDTLYYFNSQTNNINKICKFNYCHDNGSMMYDTKSNCLYVFGGKKITSCEYYSFSDKRVYKLPDLTIDRANASYIVSNNKIFAFFGFSYSQNNYAKSIEYIDYIKKDRWFELKNITLLKQNITFDTESVSTMYYRQNPNQILIYCGIQGDEEDFVTEYYLLYDAKNNTMDKIDKWNMQQYKSMGKRWKTYNFKKNDPKGFHFAKNTRFLLLPKGNNYEGYNERDPIDIMIDYKNNVHYILQEKQKIDIYRSDL